MKEACCWSPIWCGETKAKTKGWDEGVPHHSKQCMSPTFCTDKKCGAIKSNQRNNHPPIIVVGDFVLKWKLGWWQTWWLAPQLTWKDRKEQLLIFSFDLCLPLVFHTSSDLWRSSTTSCYRTEFQERKRQPHLIKIEPTKCCKNWSLGFIHLFFSFHSLSFVLFPFCSIDLINFLFFFLNFYVTIKDISDDWCLSSSSFVPIICSQRLLLSGETKSVYSLY